MSILHVAGEVLYVGAGMFWQMLWALVIGFTLSGATQVFLSKERMSQLLGKAGPKELALASFFGAASSSCSYAAAALARTLFQKGAHIISAFAFMIASTNLVIELGLVLWSLMGWQFVVAESVGGLLLIAFFAGLMRTIGPVRQFEAARGGGAKGESEGHGSCCHSEG